MRQYISFEEDVVGNLFKSLGINWIVIGVLVNRIIIVLNEGIWSSCSI